MPDRPTLRGYIAARLSHLGDVRRRALARVARWHPPTAAATVVLAGLIVHEVAYHLSRGGDFPLEVVFNGTHVFVVSHGGLDVLLSGIFVVVVLLVIDAAQIASER